MPTFRGYDVNSLVMLGAGAFWTFLIAAMAFAAIANLCYFVAVGRLVSKGFRIKFLALPKDTFRVLRQYRSLAQENKWSLWPLYGFWLSMIPFAVSATASLYVNAVSPRKNFQPVHFVNIRAVLLWVAVTSLLEAIFFSYRVSRYSSAQEVGIGDWRHWIADEYTRNDFCLAILGWISFFAASIFLVLGRVWWH